MKKLLVCLMACLLVPFMFSSCQKDEEDEVSFDKSLLTGKWISQVVNGNAYTTEHYKFTSDGMGKFWDTKDDVTEDEAQDFKWTLDKATLTITHQTVMRKKKVKARRREIAPKTYTVTELTATSLKFTDNTVNTPNVFIKVSK